MFHCQCQSASVYAKSMPSIHIGLLLATVQCKVTSNVMQCNYRNSCCFIVVVIIMISLIVEGHLQVISEDSGLLVGREDLILL